MGHLRVVSQILERERRGDLTGVHSRATISLKTRTRRAPAAVRSINAPIVSRKRSALGSSDDELLKQVGRVECQVVNGIDRCGHVRKLG